MFISLPNEKAFGAASMQLRLQILVWNKECIYTFCAATFQMTSSSSDSYLLMLAPVFCIRFLLPEKIQLSISGLTLHQPSSMRKMRATEAVVH